MVCEKCYCSSAFHKGQALVKLTLPVGTLGCICVAWNLICNSEISAWSKSFHDLYTFS